MRQHAASRHRVAGVDRQVQEDLLDLAGSARTGQGRVERTVARSMCSPISRRSIFSSSGDDVVEVEHGGCTPACG